LCLDATFSGNVARFINHRWCFLLHLCACIYVDWYFFLLSPFVFTLPTCLLLYQGFLF
jgi:hypothetical protein